MKLATVPENRALEFFNTFFCTSCFTFEGIDISTPKHKKEFKEGFEKVARISGFTEKECIGYVYKGKMMNDIYGLTDDNAYPDDLTFISIPNYYNPIVKLKLGARWFDDIVANNSIRQNAQKFDLDPDYE